MPKLSTKGKRKRKTNYSKKSIKLTKLPSLSSNLDLTDSIQEKYMVDVGNDFTYNTDKMTKKDINDWLFVWSVEVLDPSMNKRSFLAFLESNIDILRETCKVSVGTLDKLIMDVSNLDIDFENNKVDTNEAKLKFINLLLKHIKLKNIMCLGI